MEWFDQLKAEFPSTYNEIYVDIALSNAIPTCVMEAMHSFWKKVNGGANDKKLWEADHARIRQKVASMVNGKPHEIAFTRNTAEGINIIAQGMRWKPGDNVLINDQEHPNNLLPWLNLQHRGVEIRLVKAQDYRLPVDLLWSQVDKRTVVIAISFVQYCSGFRADLAALGARCREAGIKLVVDGIQGIGTIRFDAPAWNVSAVACGGHKALFAPYGTGFLYCAEDLLQELTPAYAGSSGALNVDKSAWRLDVLDAKDARRLELGTLNYAGIYGLEKGIDLLGKAGLERIEKRVLALARQLNTGLRSLGYRVLSSHFPQEQSGLVVVKVPDPAHFWQYLRGCGIRASLMDAGVVRFSPYAYNYEWEIERILEAAGDYPKK